MAEAQLDPGFEVNRGLVYAVIEMKPSERMIV